MTLPPFALVRLSPTPEVDHAAACALAGRIADILNTDEGLPDGMRRPAHLPPETAEGVLTFTRQWCLDRDAQYFALVADGRTVAGMVTISRIDPASRTARLGYALASRYHGGESRVLAAAFASAHDLGVRELSTTWSGQDTEQALWQRTGRRVELRDGRLVAHLS